MKKLVTVLFAISSLVTGFACAGTVTKGTGEILCSSYSQVDVSSAGDVVIASCQSITGVTSFVVTTTGNAAIKGVTDLPVKVTRTIGAGLSAGNDTVTLTSTVGAVFTPAQLAFLTSQTTPTEELATVRFNATGTAILSLTGVSGVTPIGNIAVTDPVSGSCAGITPPSYLQDYSANPISSAAATGFDSHNLTASSNTEVAKGAFKFTLPGTKPVSGYWKFTAAEAGPGYSGRGPMDWAISTCPGDFSPTNTSCIRLASSTTGPTISTTQCDLSAGSYYLNIRSVVAGGSVGFMLFAQPY